MDSSSLFTHTGQVVAYYLIANENCIMHFIYAFITMSYIVYY